MFRRQKNHCMESSVNQKVELEQTRFLEEWSDTCIVIRKEHGDLFNCGNWKKSPKPTKEIRKEVEIMLLRIKI